MRAWDEMSISNMCDQFCCVRACRAALVFQLIDQCAQHCCPCPVTHVCSRDSCPSRARKHLAGIVAHARHLLHLLSLSLFLWAFSPKVKPQPAVKSICISTDVAIPDVRRQIHKKTQHCGQVWTFPFHKAQKKKCYTSWLHTASRSTKLCIHSSILNHCLPCMADNGSRFFS